MGMHVVAQRCCAYELLQLAAKAFLRHSFQESPTEAAPICSTTRGVLQLLFLMLRLQCRCSALLRERNVVKANCPLTLDSRQLAEHSRRRRKSARPNAGGDHVNHA